MAYVEKEMNIKRAFAEYKVTQPTENFAIPFEFVEAEQNLRVRLNGIDIEDLGYSFLVTNNITVQVTPAIPHGTLSISRETNIDANLYKFTAGALFEARTMDKNFEQIRHSQQEVRDGFSKLATDTYAVIDGLDVALEVAKDAAQDAQDAAVIAQDAADTVNAVIIDGKVSANKVIDASGKAQQVINNNTAYFYPTVSAMVADESLTNGKAVATKGYHNMFDGGGAIYLISSVATDYSIPLNNGLHAVFNDTFDIRKFGILDNPNVDQDINLLRMTNYADTREYEIDFHNYAIRVPATALFTTDRGDTVRGIGFNKVHHLKNLNLKVNNTITQAAGLCCVGFYPKSEADCSGIFRVTNFKCDAQLTNYTGNNGAFDGFSLGFIAYPHPDWGYLMWNVANVPTMPIEFHFENVHFSTPAMSYNMSIANWKSYKIVLKNISGDYLGLYAHAFAHITDVSKVNAVYRKDLHTTMIPIRDLVTSAIHLEPEVGTMGTAYVQSIKLEDMHVVDSDGNRGLAYWHWSHGSLMIDKFTAKDIYGYVSLTKDYAMGGKIGTLVADNVSCVDVVHNVDTMRLSRVQIKPYQRIQLRPSILNTIHTLTAAHVKNLVIEDTYIEGKLCAAYDEGTRVDNLIMRNCTFDSTDYFVTLATTMNVVIERVDTKTSKQFLYARMPKLTIDGLQSYAIEVINFIKDDHADASYAWDVSNLHSKATSGFVLNGNATIDIRHSVFNSKLNVAVLPTAKVSMINTTVKPETVNAGAVTVASKGSYSTSFAMPFVKLGDVLSYSSQVDLQGCTLNVYVKSDGNCTLTVYNGTAQSLTFNPLAIYVWLNQSVY